jgi:spore maturation protein CgeB
MKTKLRIGLNLSVINTLGAGSNQVWGDEIIARSWQKYLLRRDDIEYCYLYDSQSKVEEDLDVMIHFHPGLPLYPKTKNILYLQNAFPKKNQQGVTSGWVEGGTLAVFNHIKQYYDGYMFTSQKLMKACASGAVIPFATDTEFFYPQFSEKYNYSVSFVGNNQRSSWVNQRYFYPASPFGLVIYGRGWQSPLLDYCKGILPMPDLPKLYSSCFINLNAHMEQHAEFGTINLRIYDILACGGFILSDWVDSLETVFEDAVVYTDGYEDEWAKIVYYLSNSEEREKKAKKGMELVKAKHSYAQRMEIFVKYIQEAI